MMFLLQNYRKFLQNVVVVDDQVAYIDCIIYPIIADVIIYVMIVKDQARVLRSTIVVNVEDPDDGDITEDLIEVNSLICDPLPHKHPTTSIVTI